MNVKQDMNADIRPPLSTGLMADSHAIQYDFQTVSWSFSRRFGCLGHGNSLAFTLQT